ncbi:MAG: CRISPR-associated endonuclease Cas2 [Bacteroides sp.]|nr:CRISPR-associated endonuclease Cas2 [Bacteroides sp.]
MSKKKNAADYIGILKKLKNSGLFESPSPNRIRGTDDTLASTEERVRQILGLVNRENRKSSSMLFFVMYDIESDKVRRYIVKYLQRKGCTRVQRSIFLADLETNVYEEIKNDLAEVQATYENKDSILVVPISTDYLKAMKIIGQNINLDIITHTKNTMFF